MNKLKAHGETVLRRAGGYEDVSFSAIGSRKVSRRAGGYVVESVPLSDPAE